MTVATYLLTLARSGSSENGGCLCSVWNEPASGKIVKIREVSLGKFNAAADTSQVMVSLMGLTWVDTGIATVLTPVRMDTNSPVLSIEGLVVPTDELYLGEFLGNGKVYYDALLNFGYVNSASNPIDSRTKHSMLTNTVLWRADSQAGIDPITLRGGEGLGLVQSYAGVYGVSRIMFTVEDE